ncbi:MAG: lipid-binding SYLF domain-containing protein [Geminicoccaceae bacterium]
MIGRRQLGAWGSAAVVTLLSGAALAETREQLLVDKARIVVDEFLSSPILSNIRVYMQNAYGALIVPGLLRGGFLIGVEHGTGVMVARDPQSGAWSDPAFFDLWGGSFGLQLGGQSSDVILTFMNQGAIDKLLSAKFKLGADASAAVGTLGAGVGGGTTAQFGEDVYVFAQNVGLYGGLALDGSAVLPLPDWNKAFYGQDLTPAQILQQRVVIDTPGAMALRQALSKF